MQKAVFTLLSLIPYISQIKVKLCSEKDLDKVITVI